MDDKLFFLIHGLAGHWAPLDLLGIFFAQYAIYPFFLIVLPCVWYRKKPGESILALACAGVINLVIGHFFFRARPFVTLHLAPLISGVSQGKSFPSDHTAAAFALATVFALTYPQWKWVAYAVALAIGIARVYVGVHYPGDVLGGIGVGIFSGYIMVRWWAWARHFLKKCHGK